MNAEKLRAGDVIFVRERSLLSLAIRLVTRSKWSHVAIYLGEGQVIDTDAMRRVAIHRLEDFGTWTAKRYLRLSEKKIGRIVSYMVDRMNAPYDYVQIAGFLVERLFGFKNQWNQAEAYSCGKIIDLAFQSAGIDLVGELETGDVTPQDIFASSKLYDI